MQIVLVVLLFAASASAYTKQPTIPEILAHWKSLFAPHRSECICETHVKPEILDNAFNYGEFVEDACLMCALKCSNIKLGFMDTSGRFDPARVHEVLPYVSQEIAFKCSNNSEPDLCVKSYKGTLCVYKILGGQLPPKFNDEFGGV